MTPRVLAPEEWIEAMSLESDQYQRRRIFESCPELHTRLSSVNVQTTLVAKIYAQPEAAARLAELAGWIADTSNDPYAKGISFRAGAHVAYVQTRYQDAAGLYRLAADQFRALGEESEVARTLSSGLQSLIYLGQYNEARTWGAEAGNIFSRLGDQLRLARLWTNLGNIEHRVDRHEEALALYRGACLTLENLGEPRDLAAVLSNMAVCCTSLGRFAEVRDYYERARTCAEEAGLLTLVAEADYNIAYFHFLRGEYMEAIRQYGRSRTHAEKIGDRYRAALCDLDEAEMYLELNLVQEAFRLAERAADSFRVLGMSYEWAKAVVNQAIAASQTGRFAEAIASIRDAGKRMREEGNDVWCALLDVYKATMLSRMGSLDSARRLVMRARNVLALCGLPSKLTLCDLLEAQLHQQSGAPQMAVAVCQDAITRLNGSGTPSQRFYLFLTLGQAQEQVGDFSGARESFLEASCAIEQLRGGLIADELRISVLKDKMSVYEGLFSLCFFRRGADPKSEREAFQWVQLAKSRGLADQIAWRSNSAVDQTGWDQKILDLRSELNWYCRQVEIEALLTRVRRSTERLEHLRSRMHALEDKLARAVTEHQNIAEPWAQSAPTLDAAQIQQAIPEDAALLEYYLSRGQFFAAIVTSRSLRVLPLGDAGPLHNAAQFLRFQMGKFRLGSEHTRRFAASLQLSVDTRLAELHRILIDPILEELNAAHLIIAPHGSMHGLPFHAFLKDGLHLFERFTISYAPSASVYAMCASRPSGNGHSAMVVGAMDEKAPFIDQETQTVGELLEDARILSGESATAENIFRLAPESRLIHIAAHGMYRSDNPLFSCIRLGDSDLCLLDFYRLPLQADLVTLSGCSTGLGNIVAGDEILGLMRGLLFAGARSALVTFWDVHDESTALFMKEFYGALRSGKGKSEALGAAMAAVRRVKEHPYYWAPFALVGRHAA